MWSVRLWDKIQEMSERLEVKVKGIDTLYHITDHTSFMKGIDVNSFEWFKEMENLK